MATLCSLPWCRKPISHRKRSKKFPPDRPSQLAWLDALDAGTWFSIPPETLCTGLVLCESHFDSKGNVKRRYEVPTHDSANIKAEPNVSEESNDEDVEADNVDSDYTPEPDTRSKRKGSNLKQVRINIYRVNDKTPISKMQTVDTELNITTRPKRTKGRKRPINDETEEEPSGDEEHDGDKSNSRKPTTINTELNAIDPDRLPELGSDTLERPSKSKSIGNQSGKRQSVTLMQKMEVIRMHDKGMKQSQLTKKLSLPRTTVYKIIQDREKIEQAYQAGAPLRKRIVRRGAFADINEAVYQWYEKVRTQNLFVNARVLLTMAENIANELGRTDFAPSPNWLSRFKERYNIRFTSTPAKPRAKAAAKVKKEVSKVDQGDKKEDDPHETDESTENNDKITGEVEDSWLRKDWLRNTWPEIRVKNTKTKEPYNERDIFFVEELGILYRITPKQAWQFKMGKSVDSMQNFSIIEERLTVVICSNADGSEKRKLFIVGQAQSEEMPNNLPVDYIKTTDPSNWITKSAFTRWITSWNRALECQKRKILVVLNSSPIHTFASNFSNIKIANIPTRLLSSLHPVNFGIATDFKTRYRRLLLERLINSGDCRQVTCLDALFMFSTAWNELSPELIRAAFLKAGYFSCSDVPNLPPNEFDFSSLISKAAELDLAVPLSKYSVAEYIEIDNSLCAIECTMVHGETESPSTEYDDFLDIETHNEDASNHVPVQCSLTSADAQTALENMRLYAMSRISCPQEVHNALSTLESFLLGHNA